MLAYAAVVELVGRILAGVLAIVFGWAAGAKLGSRDETVAGFADLGLPFPAVFMKLVVGAEIGTALVLLMAPRWGAILAFALLAGFTVYLAQLVRSPNPIACRCFGAASSETVSARSLLRNGVFLVMAALAAVL